MFKRTFDVAGAWFWEAWTPLLKPTHPRVSEEHGRRKLTTWLPSENRCTHLSVITVIIWTTCLHFRNPFTLWNIAATSYMNGLMQVYACTPGFDRIVQLYSFCTLFYVSRFVRHQNCRRQTEYVVQLNFEVSFTFVSQCTSLNVWMQFRVRAQISRHFLHRIQTVQSVLYLNHYSVVVIVQQCFFIVIA